MRGRGGYIPRGGGTTRGGFYPRSSSNYVNTRTQGNYRPNGGRYENNYNNRYSGGNATGGHYDNRNHDKYNQHGSSGGRYDTGHKRPYDSSRDRNDDRKRARQDDYRRTSSSNDRSDRPSSSQNMGSSSSNYHQRSSGGGGGGGGGGSSSSSYRPRDDSGSRHQRDSSMGPPKRPLLRSVAGTSYISRPRGTMRGSIMRSTMRGVGPMRMVRSRINESNDLRTMRQQLIYAKQKDRARLLKIQQLKSSLRRQRQGGNSSSSDDDDAKDNDDEDAGDKKKKQKSKTDGEADDDDHNDNEEGDDKEADAEETTKKSPIKKRSSKAATEDNGDDAANDEQEEGDVEQDGGNESESKNTTAASDDDMKDNADDESGNKDTDKPKEKSKDSAAEKTGKKKDKDVDDKEKEKSKKTPVKKERSRKDKDDKDSDDERKDKRSSRHRDDEHNNVRKRTFIKLTCVHCHIKCVTFKEYTYHLNSRTHKNSMRQVALRQRSDLQRMRARQRTAQREIEDNSKEEYESRYCRLCRLAYRQPKNLHQASDHHKSIKKFLMPYCGSCHLAFKNAMLYENHRCSLEHIRNKARNDESGSEGSADEREIDLNKFLTVDSVGEIDDDVMDADVDALLIEAETAQKSSDEETRRRGLIGIDFVKSVDTFHCALCNLYSPKEGEETLDEFSKKHCLLHAHVKAYLRHKEDTEKKLKSEAEHDDEGNEADEDGNLDGTGATDPDADEDIEMDEKMPVDDDEDEEEEYGEGEEADKTHDSKLWEEVDKDLGDLLAEVEPMGRNEEEEEEEDESVLNIDIESEKNKLKDAKEETNGNGTDDGVQKDVKPQVAKLSEKKAPATAANTAAASPLKASAIKKEPVSAKKAAPKTPVGKAVNRPGPASTKRNVLVNVKRTSAATIKAATKTAANESK
ncbi:titin homolog [Scaptodrosophila lebanonensis]|uniref:Titin homolog n=1 Tax=Drosophila lebanonensis TaxID=7225 RepID=A0A6J2TDZ6_DROLE|nr:titin homolog [Scaptodrosophila lebanonensis]